MFHCQTTRTTCDKVKPATKGVGSSSFHALVQHPFRRSFGVVGIHAVHMIPHVVIERYYHAIRELLSYIIHCLCSSFMQVARHFQTKVDPTRWNLAGPQGNFTTQSGRASLNAQ